MSKHITLFFLCLLTSALSVMSQTPISSATDLAAIDMNGSYYLTADLEVEQWTSPGVFKGVLDGRGHCITINRSVPDTDIYSGLFAVTDGADLRNLIVGGKISGFTVAAGSLVGHAINTTIRNCATEMRLHSECESAYLGGLIGVMEGGSMYNCSSNATLEGNLMGGLVGTSSNGALIKNCYSNTSFIFFDDDTNSEVGFLAHTNGGLLENNYVKVQESEWYFPSIGQLELLYGSKAIYFTRNPSHLLGWADGGWISSSLRKPNYAYSLTELGEASVLEFYNFNLSQPRPIILIHDFHGVGRNLGDILYINGIKSFVFYINDEGTGGWAVAIRSIIISGLLTSKTSDVLHDYYNTNSFIGAMDSDYARWHDGITVAGDTLPVILDGYDNSPGKFFSYTMKDSDNNPDNKVNKMKMPNSYCVSLPSIKQLAYVNNGEILRCYYPFATSVYELIKTGRTSYCTHYESCPAPYNYGEFGPYLYQNEQASNFSLVDTLNAWVRNQDSDEYVYWTVAGSNDINDNDPILQYSFDNGTAVVNTAIKIGTGFRKKALRYNHLNHLSSDQITLKNVLAYYACDENIDANNVSSPWSCSLFITENARLKGNYRLKTNVGITFDNSDASGFAGANYDWHFFSTPLADAPVGIYYQSYTNGGPYNNPSQVKFDNEKGYFPLNTPYTQWDFYCYDEPNDGWPNFKRRQGDHYNHDTGEQINFVNETKLIAGKGYLWAIGKKTGLQAFGTLNNGTVNRAVTCQGSLYRGYNLLGNPYHACLDFDAFASENASILTQNAYTILDADKQGYISYCPGASDNPVYASRYLSPNQGFFVQVSRDGSVAFKTNQTSVDAVTSFRDAISYPIINLTVTDDVGRKDYATAELERPETGGAFKMLGLRGCDGAISVSHESNEYSIVFMQGRPCSIPLRFRAFADGEFTLSWELRDLEIGYLHLIDHLTGREIDCLKETSYSFNASADDYAARFKLMLVPAEIEEHHGLEEGDFAFFSHGNLLVEGRGGLNLYDIQGRLLRSMVLEGAQQSISMPNLASGVYLIRLTTEEGTRVQKIIIP